jgi:hypothetical protein
MKTKPELDSFEKKAVELDSVVAKIEKLLEAAKDLPDSAIESIQSIAADYRQQAWYVRHTAERLRLDAEAAKLPQWPGDHRG